MSILRIRDENGNVIDVPAIKGKSAYDYAKEGGFTGTEEEFMESLVDVGKLYDAVYEEGLEFFSRSSFSISVSAPNWDGTMEYNNGNGWKIWDGGFVSATYNESRGGYAIYVRGTRNTQVTGSSNYKWTIYGFDVECNGNIEMLLDYTTVARGRHPVMATSCFANMFEGCTGLIKAPSMPAIEVPPCGYEYMFKGCTNLREALKLPAKELGKGCYTEMFRGCTGLTVAPDLPAKELSPHCYVGMFQDCTKLTTAPSLSSTELTEGCYYRMFSGCTALAVAPSLPAKTATKQCYMEMFKGCTSLKAAPALPATTVTSGCYQNMFRDCTNLITAVVLPSTVLADWCYASMYKGCTNLSTLPKLDAVTSLGEGCYAEMFNGCSSIKLSSSKTGDYTTSYTLSGDTNGNNVAEMTWYMFRNNGGTLTENYMTLGKTYYTANTVV